MQTNKKIVLGILISIFVFFIIYVVQERVRWVKSVSGKEFRGKIIQLSSKMTTGKYPSPEEYALVRWEEDGTTSYFQIAPVHNYSVGDTWITKLDLGVFETDNCCMKIPESKKPIFWLDLTYGMFLIIMWLCIIIGTIILIGTVLFWCFEKEEE